MPPLWACKICNVVIDFRPGTKMTFTNFRWLFTQSRCWEYVANVIYRPYSYKHCYQTDSNHLKKRDNQGLPGGWWSWGCTQGGVLYSETGKSPYFLNIIRKTEILSDTGILYFEGRNMARFQSHRHCYCLDRSATLCRGPNDVLVPKSDQ